MIFCTVFYVFVLKIKETQTYFVVRLFTGFYSCVCMCIIKGVGGVSHKCHHLNWLKSRRNEQTGPLIARTSVHFYILSSCDTKAKVFNFN